MITVSGDVAIGRLLSESLGSYIAVGCGTGTPSPNDERLDFEVYRAPIRSRSYDPTTKTVVYAATIPDSIALTVNEVGLMFANHSILPGGFIAMFDQDAEEWSAGEWVSTNVRVGVEGLNISGDTAVTTGATRVALTTTGKSDLIQVAYFGAGGQAEVRLTNTDTDYFSMTFPTANGFGVYNIPIHELAIVGDPEIVSVQGVTVIHSGSGSVTMDSIRVTPTAFDEDLILRQRFAPGHKKVPGMPLDIEVPIQL